ncbi:4Fe-4S binding protein [Candidatus Borrarchaeum sp.]|uniref:4Fe-4S binding protein n=1 Tax=Candidatus Borrarchaeum sp. TaxID=2846742 RepID=UPI002580DBFD|nr:4Fe-4S binding protein [Candidatus Borrarchaeum sp.]
MPEKVFYSPELTNRNYCHNCKICINVCPVKALKKTVLDIEVDRKICAEYVLSIDECIRCAAACPQGIIKLVPFVIADDGQIKRVESA